MAWFCRLCKEKHGDQFQLCWKCGADRLQELSPELHDFANPLDEVDRLDLAEGCLPYDELADSAKKFQSEQSTVLSKRKMVPEPPVPFLHRLNKYLGRDEDTPITAYDRFSRMPFYMVTNAFVRTPGKTSEYIRRILERIRETIRNCGIRE